MPAIYPIQNNFSGGELSPRLAARVDTDFYDRAVETMDNFYPLPQGTAFKRPGSQFIFETFNNTAARLFQFERGTERDYVIEMGAGYVRMFNRNGVVLGSGEQVILNREFKRGIADWSESGNFTAGPDVVVVPGPTSPRYRVALSALGTTSNFLLFEQTTSVAEIEGAPGTFEEHTYTTDFGFDPAGGVQPWNIQLLVGDGTNEDAYVDDTITTAGVQTYTFTPTGPVITIAYRFFVVSAPTIGPNWAIIQGLSMAPAGVDPLILDDVPWSEEEIFEIDTAMDLGGGDDGPDRLWFVHPAHPVYILRRITENNWTLAPAVFTGEPVDWDPDYPSSVELFSGRSWFAGVPSSRSQLWASEAGDYFALTTGPQPGEGLDLQLITRGAIKWLKGQKALLLGTDLAEHTIAASQSFAVLTVEDVDTKEQSAHGSAPVEPIIIGHEIFYITPDRTKLMATDYIRENDGWVSHDVTWAAEHITRAGIERHMWSRDPNTQILCLMQDGNITGCVYDRTYDIQGWFRQTTEGNYISLCGANDTGGTSTWYVIQRGDDYFIETTQAGEINNEFMDSWVGGTVVNGVLTGLGHLEGQTVQIVSGEFNAVEPDQVVNAGSVTIEGSGSAVAGLPYNATLKTLRTEGGNPAGTSQSSKMGYQHIVLRLNNSAVPQVNGQLPPLRNPQTPMNVPTPPLTGDSETYDLGRESQGQLLIEQPLPLRTEIVGVFGKLRSNTV